MASEKPARDDAAGKSDKDKDRRSRRDGEAGSSRPSPSSSSSGSSRSSRASSPGSSSGSSKSGSSRSGSAAPDTREGANVKDRSPLELVMMRNRFFYVFYRKQIIIFVGALVLAALSLASSVYFAGRKTPPQFLAASADTRVLPSHALDEPSLPASLMDPAVTEWTWQAAQHLYNYDYINWRQQINQGQDYFTVRGWNDYLGQLKDSKTLDSVQNLRLISHIQPTGAPQIVAKTIMVTDGVRRLAWSVEFPVQVRFTANRPNTSGFVQQGVLKMVVLRVSMADSPKGIAIDQFNFTLETGSTSFEDATASAAGH